MKQTRRVSLRNQTNTVIRKFSFCTKMFDVRLISVSMADDSEPHQLLHSGKGYWILSLVG